MTIERPIIQKWEKHTDTQVCVRASYLMGFPCRFFFFLGMTWEGVGVAMVVEFGSIKFKVSISRLTLPRLPFSIEIGIAIGNIAISIFGGGRRQIIYLNCDNKEEKYWYGYVCYIFG